jgi:hypothetical protein
MSETNCGQIHLSIQEAIRHAEENLGTRYIRLEPFWGTMRMNLGLVVGYKLNDRKRYRLDYAPDKGAHVNEENFENVSPSKQKICHPIQLGPRTAEYQVTLQWRKWTSRYNMPDEVREAVDFEIKSR